MYKLQTRGLITALFSSSLLMAAGVVCAAPPLGVEEPGVAKVVVAQNAPTAAEKEETKQRLKAEKDAGQWVQPAKNYANTRFSGLDQVNVKNVANLQVAWTFSTGTLRGHESAPLVVGDTMYLVTPFPNYVYAIDLKNPDQIKWKFAPNPDEKSIGVACCDTVNRGVSYADGKILFNTLDGVVYALDAGTGAVVWSAKNAYPSVGETMTNAPIVINGRVIVGVSGGEFGIRGRLTAYDLNTGKRVWRYYNQGPDSEVGIGERFKPFYSYLKGKDLGVTTWPKDQWKLGGSSVWGWFSYDPELNLVYYGTSNPGTWSAGLRRPTPELKDQVAWANRWATSVMARNPDTGELVWAFNWTPHDEWDYDGINENVLVDLKIKDKMRKTMVHFDRNGFAFVVDRATGELLSAEPYGAGVNWATGYDLKTGLPHRNPAKSTKIGVDIKNICPSAMGFKDKSPSAYSPETGLFYVPTNNLCMDLMGQESQYIAGVPYVGAAVHTYAGPGGNRGAFMAWDPVKAKRVWSIEERLPVWSGALVTAGNLAFYGTMEGWLKAVDATTGKVLWKFKTGSGIIGEPMTYTGPDGNQYIAVYSGVGGWAGLTVAGDLSLDDPSAALGAVNAFNDLGRYTQKGGMLYVFSLKDIGEKVAQVRAGKN